jgi:hypothetical protein
VTRLHFDGGDAADNKVTVSWLVDVGELNHWQPALNVISIFCSARPGAFA